MSFATRLLLANPGAQVTSALTGSLTTPGAKGAFIAEPVSAFDALSTVIVPSGGLSSITFAGIPQTGYSHLQIRIMALTNNSLQSATFTLNDTSGGTHWLTGNGSTIQAAYQAGILYFPLTQGSTTTPVAGVMDILDYTNTSKNKTIRTIEGCDLNGSGNVSFTSGLWLNTSAINKITMTPASSGVFREYSSFALYGVK